MIERAPQGAPPTLRIAVGEARLRHRQPHGDIAGAEPALLLELDQRALGELARLGDPTLVEEQRDRRRDDLQAMRQHRHEAGERGGNGDLGGVPIAGRHRHLRQDLVRKSLDGEPELRLIAVGVADPARLRLPGRIGLTGQVEAEVEVDRPHAAGCDPGLDQKALREQLAGDRMGHEPRGS